MDTLPGSGGAAANLGDPVSRSTTASSPSWSSPPGFPGVPRAHGRGEASWKGSRVFLGPVGGKGRGQARLSGCESNPTPSPLSYHSLPTAPLCPLLHHPLSCPSLHLCFYLVFSLLPTLVPLLIPAPSLLHMCSLILTPLRYSSYIFISNDILSLIQIRSLHSSPNPFSIQSPTSSPSTRLSLTASSPVPFHQPPTHREAVPGLEGQGDIRELISQGQEVQAHSWQVRFSLWGKVC